MAAALLDSTGLGLALASAWSITHDTTTAGVEMCRCDPSFCDAWPIGLFVLDWGLIVCLIGSDSERMRISDGRTVSAGDRDDHLFWDCSYCVWCNG
jgi:hypothetical protein